MARAVPVNLSHETQLRWMVQLLPGGDCTQTQCGEEFSGRRQAELLGTRNQKAP